MIAAEPNAIRFDPELHQYWNGLERYHSVSSVIRACWPIKKSFDGVDPAVLVDAACLAIAPTDPNGHHERRGA